MLVGGGELHDRWSSFVRCNRPLGRGIQRFTGITQEMLADAPGLEEVLPSRWPRWLDGRVLVAHNAPFDRRVLRRAFELIGFEWPNPPVLCTAALARKLLPLQNRRGLTVLAGARPGSRPETAHRALADAETCTRVFCALFPRLCANALADRRRDRTSPNPAAGAPSARKHAKVACRDDAGPARLRRSAARPRRVPVPRRHRPRGAVRGASRSRSAAGPGRISPRRASLPASWTTQATVVDYQSIELRSWARWCSRNQLDQAPQAAGEHPPHAPRTSASAISVAASIYRGSPILEVASEPAAGHAVTIRALRGRRLAQELVERLDSLFGLRHCGRRVEAARASLGLRADGALLVAPSRLWDPRSEPLPALARRGAACCSSLTPPTGASCCCRTCATKMGAAVSDQQLYERAAWLRRRLRRRLRGGSPSASGARLEATHVRAKLVLAPHPVDQNRHDAFWLVRGRLVEWGPAPEDSAALEERTEFAIRRGGRAGELGAHVPPDEIDELRIIATYLASHPELPEVMLERRELSDTAASSRGRRRARVSG